MISVIIPSYNRAGMIERSAKSVLEQTYQDLELIIVDDCSSDNTEDVVAGIAKDDPRVRYIRHEKNQGACAARNTGIRAAKGEYIAFQDSDDAWRAEKLEKQLQALQKYDADICYCKMERHNYPANLDIYYPDGLAEGIVDYEMFIARYHASTQTILVKADLCKANEFRTEMKKIQDLDWCIRAGRNHKTAFVDEVLVDAYLQEDSISAPKDFKKSLVAFETILNNYGDVCREYKLFHLRLLNQIGKLKMQLGDRSGNEYRTAYEVSGNFKYMVKHVLYKLNILSTYYKLKK